MIEQLHKLPLELRHTLPQRSVLRLQLRNPSIPRVFQDLRNVTENETPGKINGLTVTREEAIVVVTVAFRAIG